ncbi:biotin/lipoate--protein ligase family protein [Oceanicella sp. SM1341]|uniref:biotin/lipoate--protein ligase family protein n=1 Tax=Oceanicella sp. SM1341 TaxID=1548889 RepID=UPI000E4FE53E|nr:biotin/lipoate--protein ligase family protein [Oceanicella sp. SM1341]
MEAPLADDTPRLPEEEPVFPPLLRGSAVPAGGDPLARAVAAAVAGVEAGTIFWSGDEAALEAAVVFAPECPLAQALAMVPAAATGLAEALGSLAPPEVGMTFAWPDGVLVNGALCGRLRAEASVRDPAAVPDWLVVAVTLQLAPLSDEPGRTPGITALAEEGCADITRRALLEAWARHMLVRVHDWLEDGPRGLSEAWWGRIEGRGGETPAPWARPRRDGAPAAGRPMGLDESLGLVLSSDEGVQVLPLAGMLDHPRPWPDPEALA